MPRIIAVFKEGRFIVLNERFTCVMASPATRPTRTTKETATGAAAKV